MTKAPLADKIIAGGVLKIMLKTYTEDDKAKYCRGFKKCTLPITDYAEKMDIPVEKLKKITNYEMQEMFKSNEHLEKEKTTTDIEMVKEHYKKVISNYNTLAKRYTRVKNIVDEMIYKAEKMQEENDNLKRENKSLKAEVTKLKDYIDKTIEYVSLLFDFSKDKLKRLVKSFIEKINLEK